MNAKGGPSEARRAKEGASADSAEEISDTTDEVRDGFIEIAAVFPPCKPGVVPSGPWRRGEE